MINRKLFVIDDEMNRYRIKNDLMNLNDKIKRSFLFTIYKGLNYKISLSTYEMIERHSRSILWLIKEDDKDGKIEWILFYSIKRQDHFTGRFYRKYFLKYNVEINEWTNRHK